MDYTIKPAAANYRVGMATEGKERKKVPHPSPQSLCPAPGLEKARKCLLERQELIRCKWGGGALKEGGADPGRGPFEIRALGPSTK